MIDLTLNLHKLTSFRSCARLQIGASYLHTAYGLTVRCIAAFFVPGTMKFGLHLRSQISRHYKGQ